MYIPFLMFPSIIFLILFRITTTGQLIAVEKENQKWIYITKPLMMPLLALYYAVSSIQMNEFDWLIVAALLAGCAGDTFLMLKGNENYFLLGMVSFLLGHIFYIISFILSMGTDIVLMSIAGPLLFIPVLVILYFTFPRFKDKMGDYKIPVYVYMVAILLMHVFAILRGTQYPLYCSCFILTYIGSILFILSDSLIAVDKFGEKKIPRIRSYIMETYILGQFLITMGVLLAGYLY